MLRTVARFGAARAVVDQAALGGRLAMTAHGHGAAVEVRAHEGAGALARSSRLLGEAAADDQRWLAHRRPLGTGAPAWAQEMYERSLLTLRALTGRNGAVAAGARDDWAYVWPRDASATAIAFAAAGYRDEARRVVRFLLGLGLERAARFHGDGSPVPGRPPQGDAIGWVAAASQAAGIVDSARHAARILAGDGPIPWRDRADYWEGEPGDYLGNAIASRRRRV